MAVRSKTTIFNAALLRTGHEETQSGGIWRAMEANYDEIVRQAFEDGDGVFPFGRQREELTSRSDGYDGYEDAYKLPDGAIHVIEVFLDAISASDALIPWDVDASSNNLLLDAGGRKVEVKYVKEGLEHTWSANFAMIVQRRLEAVIKDVMEESEEAAAKEQEADFFAMKAGVKGSKNRSQRRVWKRGGGRLIRARRGGS